MKLTFLTQSIVPLQHIFLIITLIHNFLLPPTLRMSPCPRPYVSIKRIVGSRSRMIRPTVVGRTRRRSSRSTWCDLHGFFRLQSAVALTYIIVACAAGSSVIVTRATCTWNEFAIGSRSCACVGSGSTDVGLWSMGVCFGGVPVGCVGAVYIKHHLGIAVAVRLLWFSIGRLYFRTNHPIQPI
jgi:hypothetical protein